MNAELLEKVFNEIKTTAKLDYAVIYADTLGDCNTCVNDELCDLYGVESKGIYAKYWRYGMNKCKPLKDCKELYIAHDVTPEQGELILAILRKYFTVTNAEYDSLKCFNIIARD